MPDAVIFATRLDMAPDGMQEMATKIAPVPGADFFDRLLVAQAMSEPLRFLTANAALRGYSELVEVA